MQMKTVSLAIGALAFSGSASAQLTFSFDETAFAASSNLSDTYAAYATPGGPDLAIPLANGSAVLGDFKYTPMGTEDGLGELEVRAASSSEPAEENSLFGFLDGPPTEFTFSISAVMGPMTAIGFDFLSADSLGGAIVSFDNGESFRVADQLGNPGTGFLGISSATQFSEVTFTVANGASFEGLFIETIYASAIPAPATASLLGGLLLAGRRRR